MLQLTTKWMTNSLAKKSIQTNDFIACVNDQRLYVVGYGVITNGGKNTYNVVVKDSDDKVISEHTNLYLDAITKFILGSTPKAKANKDSEASKQANKDSLLLTFDEAFSKACSMVTSYQEAAKILGKYDEKDACLLALHLIKDAQQKEVRRLKDEKKRANIEALQRTLAIAIESQNNTMIEQIRQMIYIEESM